MFSGRRSARAGAPVGAPFAASVSGRTGVEVFSGKTGKPQSVISGHVADFARGKSEPGLAARSRTVAGGCSGGRAARALVDSAADTAAATENENRSGCQRLNNSAVRTLSTERAPGSRSRCLHIGSELRFWFATTLFSAELPGPVLPEVFQRTSAPAKNIAFRLADVGYTRRVSRAWKIAFAIAAILPEVPEVPRRRGARFIVIIGNP